MIIIMKIFEHKNLWRGLAVVFGLLLAVFIVLTNLAYRYAGFVNDFFGIVPPTIDAEGDTLRYASKYGDMNAENNAKLIADENAFNITAMEEGAVLVRNENNALPLAANERRITIFGNSAADPVYAMNGGGAGFKAARGGSLKDAFTSAGFAINETVFSAYQNSGVRRNSTATPGQSSIGEVSSSFYTDALRSSYANDYNDVAVVIFTRYGGEGVDLEYVADRDGVPLLSFHKSEEDLMKMIKQSGKFKKTVVLINSPFAMDLEWIEDYETYGVDACLTFGAAGDVGFIGIANILTGKADPSGHLTDTYAANSLSAPAMRNFGDFTYSNMTKAYSTKYVVYAENIYVGYKYYETRYYDCVLGINNANGASGVYASENNAWNYADEMAYTFGYGLSYARFTEEVQSIVWDREAHTVTAKVKVTNEGAPNGSNYTGKSKHAVQLYASAPWKEGQAEKSAIELIGFAKTGSLAAGESEEVTVTASDYLFAAYDENATNGADASKKGCYVFDEGDYFFAVGGDAHDALNNVIAKKHPDASGLTDEKGNAVTGNADKAVGVVLAEKDDKTYARSSAESSAASEAGTYAVVSNRFDDIDYNYFSDGVVTYLTRADWNTYPKAYVGLEATSSLKTVLDNTSYQKTPSTPDSSTVKIEANAGMEFVEMYGVDYFDSKWETFLDQLTLSDLATVMGETMGNARISTVNKPANANTDGPKGLGSVYRNGDGTGITLYVDQVVMSSTFNLELLKRRGELFAEDALYAGYSMIFGPGADWHRSAYGGRNSEYYSEDPNMSYLCGAAQVKAMQEGGLIAAIKHFVGNDQETNRHGVSTFATEQGFRQGSLRCFEGALRDDVGSGLGTMTCFNRVGAVAGAASEAVLTGVLREEWGFKGVNLTDSSKDASDYVLTRECTVAGTDMFNNDSGRTTELANIIRRDRDGTILLAMKTANKHFYYAYANSNLVNGLEKGVEVANFVPWWQPVLTTLIVVFAVLIVASIVMFVLGTYVFGKKEARHED